jgi:hypothetical protein
MHEQLADRMRKQNGVFRRRQALAVGYTPVQVQQKLDSGEWIRVRQGIYTTRERYGAASATTRGAHMLAAAARMLAISGDLVVSHRSAAVFHRIPLLDDPPEEPDLTRHQLTVDRRHTAHDLFLAPVPPADRVTGLPIATAGRAVADCARYLEPDAAFVTLEAALHLGLDRVAIGRVLLRCAGWPGAAQARELLMVANPWSESVLESLARLWFKQQGLPQPMQQRSVFAGRRFLGRVDFVWPEYHTVCEMDGQVKYAEELPDAMPAPTGVTNAPLWREKRREDDLRDVELQVVRGYWSDRDDRGAALAGRLRRAFVRGQRHAGEPSYRLEAPVYRRNLPLSRAV